MKRSCPDGIDFDNFEWFEEESVKLYPLDEDKGVWFGNSRPALTKFFGMVLENSEADVQEVTKKLLEVIEARHEKCRSIGRAVDVLLRRPCYKDASLEAWTDILLDAELVHWNETFMEGEHYTDHKGVEIMEALHQAVCDAASELSMEYHGWEYREPIPELKPLKDFAEDVLGQELAWEEMSMEISMLWSATHDFIHAWKRYDRRDGDEDKLHERALKCARLLFARRMVILCKAFLPHPTFGLKDGAERAKKEDANFCYDMGFSAEEIKALEVMEDSDAKPETYSQSRLYNGLRTRVARLYRNQPRKKTTFAKLRVNVDLSKGERSFASGVAQQATQA